MIGDEFHSLTDCVRAASTRHAIRDAIAEIFAQKEVVVPADRSIVDMLRMLDKLPYRKQQQVWNKVGSLTAAIRQAMKAEAEASNQVANNWMQVLRASQIKSLGDAA